jgi:hypothetical protein
MDSVVAERFMNPEHAAMWSLVDRVEALFIRSQAKESKSSLWRRMTKVSATAGLTMTWN